MKQRAILFDMDGLMLDTKRTWVESERELLARYGKVYDKMIAAQYQGMRASGVIDVMRREYSLPVSQHAAEQYFTAMLVQRFETEPLALFPGCRELIQDLHEHDFKLAIASSSPKRAITAVVKRFDLTPYFHELVSGEEVLHGKPAPDIYLHAAELVSAAPQHCVVLEDAPKGALAGKSAHMHVVAVYNREFYSPPDFDGIADVVVDSLQRLNAQSLTKLIG